MSSPLIDGKATLILKCGEVHLLKHRKRGRARSTMCGAAVTGEEQSGNLMPEDIASLPGFNVCRECIKEFQRAGHFLQAIVALSKAAPPAALRRPLDGQLALFDR